MENQHRKIKGYRELSQTEIDFMNTIKTLGDALGEMFDKLEQHPDIDKRWLAIGKTDMQTGIMAAVRAVARPTTF